MAKVKNKEAKPAETSSPEAADSGVKEAQDTVKTEENRAVEPEQVSAEVAADRQKQAAKKYDATTITVLEGMDAVRMRPAMYIGDTAVRGSAPLRLRGGGQQHRRGAGRLSAPPSRSQLNADGSVTVNDNGRGIPVDMHATEKKPAAGSRADDPARRRQVRQRQLQGFRRPARRRRVLRQRAQRVAGGRGPARRQRLSPALREGRHGLASWRRSARPRAPAPRSPSCPTRTIFTTIEVRVGHPRQPPARTGVPEQGRRDQAVAGGAGRARKCSSSRAASWSSSST